MPKSLDSPAAHVDDIVAGRRRTRDARFKPLPGGVEPVADVLRQALDGLHASLQPLGFRALPSQLALSRKAGELTQLLRLRPAGTNLSGASVEITAEALVRSPGLKRWTAAAGTGPARDLLWIRQLGNLGGQHRTLKWQLVDPSTRAAELQDLLQQVRTLALPAFDAWATKASIANAVFRGTEMDRADWLAETALWAGSPQAAAGLVAQHLARHPRDVPAYTQELARFRAAPATEAPTALPASRLAHLVVHHGLAVADAAGGVAGTAAAP